MTRIVYRSEPGVFARVFLETGEAMERAAQAAVMAAGEQAKTDGKANILSAGLGNRFANALRLNVYPKKGASLRPRP
jgi:hypothetical protein